MRKFLALALAIVMVFSMTIMASAENTTVLTTTVPDAKYTLNIPADQKIDFGAPETEIGGVTVTDSSGFAEGKNLKLTLTFNPFSSNETSTTIPYVIKPGLATSIGGNIPLFTSGKVITFRGQADGSATERPGIPLSNGNYADIVNLKVVVESADWGKALGGSYSSTITFTTEVVVE